MADHTASRVPEPFLRIPPFPGARSENLVRPGTSRVDPRRLAEALRHERVGGRFWGARATLQPGREMVLAPDSPAQLATMLERVAADQVSVFAPVSWSLPRGAARIDPLCEAWDLAEQARHVWAGADHEFALVAALAGRPIELAGVGDFTGCDHDPAEVAAQVVGRWRYACPFTGADLPPEDAIAQLGEWRRLIESNRTVDGVLGVAGWKRVTLDPLLWDGAGPVRHLRRLPEGAGPASRFLVWKSRAGEPVLEALKASAAQISEIEDGFIRSAGLGANCVPPLSAVVDHSGIYFDPSAPSDLESLLERADIGPALCARAAALRERLVQAGISKYGQGGQAFDRPAGSRRRVLVTGQVEDDRSMLCGGTITSNLELLSRARSLEPDAWIIYKPHPDVEAGHRKGHVRETEVRRYADEIERDAPIAALLDAVDAVHVITSLAGFEALLRGLQVTTHGIPFYAGWGLTRDLAPRPPRRSANRTLDQLVAAALILYPRYVDPETGLPCPPEVLVGRIEAGQSEMRTVLVNMREWQGRLKLLGRRVMRGI